MTDNPTPPKQGRPRVRDAIAAMTPEQREQFDQQMADLRREARKAQVRRPYKPIIDTADPVDRCKAKQWKKNPDGPRSCIDAWAQGSIHASDGCPKCRQWLRALVDAAAGRPLAWSEPMNAD